MSGDTFHRLARGRRDVSRGAALSPAWARAARPLAALCLLLSVSASPLRGDEAEPSAVIVARIDGQPIYRATYLEVLKRAGYDAATTPQERQQIAAKVVEELINEQLIGQLLADNGVEVMPGEIDAMIASLRTQLSARQQTLEAFLSESGRDEAMLRKQMATELGLNKLLVPRLTRDRLQAFYDERRQEFDGTRLRVSHLVLRPNSAAGDTAEQPLLAVASALREAILDGQLTFSEAVRRHSAGQSRLRDGDLGFIPRHGLMHEAFATEAFRLAQGDVSEPFVTPFGVHLVTVTDVEPGRGSFAASMTEVQKQCASELLREMLDTKRQAADIVYSPGIPHFQEAAGDRSRRRTVVVEPVDDGNGGG